MGGRALFLFVMVAPAVAQTAGGERPRFAVASVKVSKSSGRPEIGNFHGRGYAKNATLKAIVATAYQVPVFQIVGGPAWADSERFDIEARAEDPNTGYIQLRLMAQSLLEDRFHLRLRRETRMASVYLLETSKGGVKMSRSADQTSSDAMPGTLPPHDDPPRGGVLSGPGLLEGNAVPMALFVKVLTPRLERPIVDKTNLGGRYDIRLKWAPENPSADGGENAPKVSDLPGLFTALREQLGLELKAGRAPVEFLKIDSAEQPSAN